MSTPTEPLNLPAPVPRPAEPEPPAPTRTLPRRSRDDGAATGRRSRLIGIDAARGVALLGMMAVHSLVVADPGPTATWDIAGGRAAALFAVLAGVGIAFTTGRARVGAATARQASTGLLARAAVIGLLGLVLGLAVDPDVAGVILAYYAVLFVAAIPLVMLPSALVWLVGIGGAIGLPFASSELRASMSEATLGNPSLADLVTDPAGLVRELVFTGLYPALTWIAYVAVGIAVGRMRLSSRRVAAGLAAGGSTVAVLATTVSSLILTFSPARAAMQADATARGMSPEAFTELLTVGGDGVTPPTTWWWLALDTRHTSTPVDLLHTLGAAVAVIGVLLLLGHLTGPLLRGVTAVVMQPLAAAGAMTLTFYTLHLLFITSNLDTYSPVTGYVLQVVAVLLVGLAWRATAGRGPLERLVSRVAGRR